MLPTIAHPTERPADCLLRVAVWGDLHCAEDVDVWYPDCLRAAQDVSAAHAPDLVIQLGDVMGGHDTAHLWTPRERAVYLPILRRFSETAPTVFLFGNHDGEAAWHTALASTFPIHVAMQAGPIHMTAAGCSVYVWALPFPHRGHLAAGRTFASVAEETATLQRELANMLADWGRDIAELRQDDPGSLHIIATHATWNGAIHGGGEVYQPGGDICVDPADLVATGADLIVGGHIHGAQLLAPRCFLAGSTRHLGHGESGETRYHWLVDLYSGVRAPDIAADADHLQFTASDSRGSCVATGLPTGAPRWLTVQATWDGTRFVESDIPDRAAGAQVRLEVHVDEEHAASLPSDEVIRSMLLSGVSTFGQPSVTRKVARPPRQVRAPAVLEVDREDPVAMLRCWVEARGLAWDIAQEKRLRRNLEDGARDPVRELAARHPALARTISLAAGRKV